MIKNILLLTPILIFSSPPIDAGEFKKTSIAEIALGQNSTEVAETLKTRYPGCAISTYHHLPDLKFISRLETSNNFSDEDPCVISQIKSGRIDHVRVYFAHPEVEESSPAYQIEFKRHFNENSFLGWPTFQEIVTSISQEFGRPIIFSFGLDKQAQEFNIKLAKILNDPKPGPQETRLKYEALWTELPTKKLIDFCTLDLCGNKSLRLLIQGEGFPKSKIFQAEVSRGVDLTLEDHVIGSKQNSFVFEREHQKKLKATQF